VLLILGHSGYLRDGAEFISWPLRIIHLRAFYSPKIVENPLRTQPFNTHVVFIGLKGFGD
jgi:hypothetical protein